MHNLFCIVFHFQLTRNQSLIFSFSTASWWVTSIPSNTMDDSSAMQVTGQVLHWLSASKWKQRQVHKEMPCVPCSRCAVGNVILLSKLSMHPKCFKLYHRKLDYKNNWLLVDVTRWRPIYSTVVYKQFEMLWISWVYARYILKNFSNVVVGYIGDRIPCKIALHFGL